MNTVRVIKCRHFTTVAIAPINREIVIEAVSQWQRDGFIVGRGTPNRDKCTNQWIHTRCKFNTIINAIAIRIRTQGVGTRDRNLVKI